MRLDALQLQRIRNIDAAELEPSPGFNLIVGSNAAGKTSVLEAIDFLSRGRSFRAARPDELIQSSAEQCRVVARVSGENLFATSRMGIQRARGVTRARVDGREVAGLAALARRIGVVVIEPLSVSLVSGAPGERRAFLDWGAFHFHEGFLERWQRYGRLLAQRNALLKQRANTRMLKALDQEFGAVGEEVDAIRDAYLVALRSEVERFAEPVMGNSALTFRFRRGWREGESLIEGLDRQRSVDSERGFTGVGPHRADIELSLDGDSLSKIGSRGQQKASMAVLKLAQAGLYGNNTGERAVLLLDDVASELDREHRAGVMSGVESLGGQVFITAIEAGMIDVPPDAQSRMFHVEHGQVQDLI